MSAWTVERARVASLSRSRTPDDPDLIAARRNLKAARFADLIQGALPDLTPEHREHLAAMIAPPKTAGMS